MSKRPSSSWRSFQSPKIPQTCGLISTSGSMIGTINGKELAIVPPSCPSSSSPSFSFSPSSSSPSSFFFSESAAPAASSWFSDFLSSYSSSSSSIESSSSDASGRGYVFLPASPNLIYLLMSSERIFLRFSYASGLLLTENLPSVIYLFNSWAKTSFNGYVGKTIYPVDVKSNSQTPSFTNVLRTNMKILWLNEWLGMFTYHSLQFPQQAH